MKKKQQRDREHAVTAHLKGESITAIANKLGYTRPWVYKWVKRYQAQVEQEEWQADKAKRPLSNSRQLPGIAKRTFGFVRLPFLLLNLGLVPFHPFVNPRSRVSQLIGNRRYRFAFQVCGDRMFSVALLFLLHAFLPKEKGSNDETTPLQSLINFGFQRTVNDVVALPGVNDVMALIT